MNHVLSKIFDYFPFSELIPFRLVSKEFYEALEFYCKYKLIKEYPNFIKSDKFFEVYSYLFLRTGVIATYTWGDTRVLRLDSNVLKVLNNISYANDNINSFFTINTEGNVVKISDADILDFPNNYITFGAKIIIYKNVHKFINVTGYTNNLIGTTIDGEVYQIKFLGNNMHKCIKLNIKPRPNIINAMLQDKILFLQSKNGTVDVMDCDNNNIASIHNIKRMYFHKAYGILVDTNNDKYSFFKENGNSHLKENKYSHLKENENFYHWIKEEKIFLEDYKDAKEIIIDDIGNYLVISKDNNVIELKDYLHKRDEGGYSFFTLKDNVVYPFKSYNVLPNKICWTKEVIEKEYTECYKVNCVEI